VNKSETSTNAQNTNDQNRTGLEFGYLNFEFVSNFDIRISDLNKEDGFGR
jgi:hypothetical protein